MYFSKKVVACSVFLALLWMPQYNYAGIGKFFRNGAFGWVWQPEVRLDGKTRKMLEGYQQEVVRLNDILEDMPYQLQQKMLPLIDRASREMERVFYNSINQFGDRMEDLSDQVFDELNQTLSKSFYELNQTVDYFFVNANQLIDTTFDRAEMTVTKADYLLGLQVDKVDQITKNRLADLDRNLMGLVGEVDATLSANIRVFDEGMNRFLVNATDMLGAQGLRIVSELDLATQYGIKAGSKEMQHVITALEKSGIRVVSHAIAGGERLLEQFDGIIQEALEEARVLLGELDRIAGKHLEKADNNAKGWITQAEEAGQGLLQTIVRLLFLLPLLGLGYKVGSMALEGTLTALPRYRAVAFGAVAMLCMILLLWQAPLLSLFSGETQSVDSFAEEEVEQVDDYRIPQRLKASLQQ